MHPYFDASSGWGVFRASRSHRTTSGHISAARAMPRRIRVRRHSRILQGALYVYFVSTNCDYFVYTYTIQYMSICIFSIWIIKFSNIFKNMHICFRIMNHRSRQRSFSCWKRQISLLATDYFHISVGILSKKYCLIFQGTILFLYPYLR